MKAKISRDLEKYSRAFLKHIDSFIKEEKRFKKAMADYEKAKEKITTRHAEWRVRLKKKGYDISLLDTSYKINPANCPQLVRKKIQHIAEHPEEWSSLID